RAGEDLRDLPALGRAVGAALLDAHEVARLGLADLVVRREALAYADDLFVERVLAKATHLHDHGLRLLRRDDHADLGLPPETAPRRDLGLGGAFRGRFGALARHRPARHGPRRDGRLRRRD